MNIMATLSPTAPTAAKTPRDRANYLPLEAQSLRRCIAGLYEECFSLSKKAEQEDRRKSRAVSLRSDIWDIIDLYTDDIRGYASYARLRVPVAYPADAASHLKQSAIFEVPGVMDWLTEEGQDRPKMRHYLETVDYLRLQVLDYIQRFDHFTIDQKSF